MRESIERHEGGGEVALVLEERPVPLRGRVVETFQNSFQFVSGATSYDFRYSDVKEIRTSNGASNAPEQA